MIGRRIINKACCYFIFTKARERRGVEEKGNNFLCLSFSKWLPFVLRDFFKRDGVG